MPNSMNTPKPKSNVVSNDSTDLDIVATTPKADETAEPTAIKDKLVNAAPDNNTPERDTSVISDENTDLDIFIAALEANKLKAITDESVDSVQDNPTLKRDPSTVNDDNVISDKKADLAIDTTTPKSAKPKVITDNPVDAVEDNNTPERNISVVSDEIIGDKETDLAISTTSSKTDEPKVTTNKLVDTLQDNHPSEHDTNIVNDDNVVSDKKSDLAIVATTPKAAEPKVTIDKSVDAVQDNNTRERDTSIVSNEVIGNKGNDLAISTTSCKTDESAKPNAVENEFSDFTPQADAPAPVHVTSGSSLTPKGRLTKTPKSVANGSRAFIWYLLALIVLVVDQWTKWLAETNLTFNEPVSVIEPFLNWTLAYNYGAAFSFLADAGGWQKWFFSGLALVMSIALIVYLAKAPRQAKLLSFGLALVLGGAVGNLIDRLLHGHVIDFIHVHYADVWNYPIFNIADMGICIGVAIIIIDMIFLEGKRKS